VWRGECHPNRGISLEKFVLFDCQVLNYCQEFCEESPKARRGGGSKRVHVKTLAPCAWLGPLPETIGLARPIADFAAAAEQVEIAVVRPADALKRVKP
jgi:hypothetical protein